MTMALNVTLDANVPLFHSVNASTCALLPPLIGVEAVAHS